MTQIDERGSVWAAEQIIVTQAKMLKRTAIHGRGRSGVLHKRRSHMTVGAPETCCPDASMVLTCVARLGIAK